jgi:hypothetical protein
MQVTVPRFEQSVVCILVAMLLAPRANAEPAQEKVTVIVMPLKVSGLPQDAADVLDSLTAVLFDELSPYKVVSVADINAQLGLEKMKQIAGCDSASCAAEIAGSLGAQRILSGSVGRVGKVFLVSLTLIDVKNIATSARGRAKAESFRDLHEKAFPQAIRAVLKLAEPEPRSVATVRAETFKLDAIGLPFRHEHPAAYYVLQRARVDLSVAVERLEPALREKWQSKQTVSDDIAKAQLAFTAARKALGERRWRGYEDGSLGKEQVVALDKELTESKQRFDANVATLETQERVQRGVALKAFRAATANAATQLLLCALEYEEGYDRYLQAFEAHERAMDAWYKDPKGAEPAQPKVDLSVSIAAGRRAMEATTPREPMGQASRYYVAYGLEQMEKGDEALPIYRELAEFKGGAFFAEAQLRIGIYLFDQGQLGQAEETFRAALADTKLPAYLRSKILYHQFFTHTFQGKQALALSDGVELMELTGPRAQELVSDISGNVALLTRRFGGMRAPQLAVASEWVLGRVGAVLASDALDRLDYERAARTWAAIAKRAAGSIEAPVAVASLAAYATHMGDLERAAQLTQRLRDDFGLDSPWRRKLTAGRDDSGYPDETALDNAARPRVPEFIRFSAGTKEERRAIALRRTKNLASSCGRTRTSLPSAKPVALALAVTVKDGELAKVSAAVAGADPGNGAALAACLRDDAPLFFAGAIDGVDVTLRFLESE